VLVDIGPELDPRGTSRIRMEVESSREPVFASVDEYARLLSLHYPAAQPAALGRMARHGVRPREDGRFVLKMAPALRGAGFSLPPEEAALRERLLGEEQWQALRRVTCPTLVVRGAASDVFSPEVADRMTEEALAKGVLAIVPRAGHSVMTDNPRGFRDAVAAFVLSE
jgi:pimeloyl-ACP methyl ester carboxylesterase